MKNHNPIKIKYLSNLAEKFTLLGSGIKLNEDKWKSFNITSEAIEKHINNIFEKGKEIEILKTELSKKLTEARILKDEKKVILDQLEKRAVGIHADETNKLKDYGL
ncbi:MAG: hypothetical protein IT280_05910 [Ignavibacteria bacterium]|nr:hypothetical protein [Ignavibacteria bacterium]